MGREGRAIDFAVKRFCPIIAIDRRTVQPFCSTSFCPTPTLDTACLMIASAAFGPLCASLFNLFRSARCERTVYTVSSKPCISHLYFKDVHHDTQISDARWCNLMQSDAL